MHLALAFALADLFGGLYLLWCVRKGCQRRPEPAVLVGVTLLVATVFLGVVASEVGHRPPMVEHRIPSGGSPA